MGAARISAKIVALVATGGCAIAVGGFMLAAPSVADGPLPPPHRYTECSVSEGACFTSDPEEGTFRHARGAADAAKARWRVPGWHRVAYLADDGDHLVTGYDGMNLVPIENPGQVEILTFWRRGEPVRCYRLSELVSTAALVRTASHQHWGDYEGFDPDGNFRLSTVEGVVLVFSPATGEIVRRQREER